MPFVAIIITRILFAACMVFIIGYVFGNFSKKASLTTITKFAAILAIVLFVSANIIFFRFGGLYRGNFQGKYNCGWRSDSTVVK